MALNLAPIIPAIFTGPNGEQLTPEQIRDRQLIAQSLMAQATDTSPNAGGWASILAKGVQGFQAGRERRSADNATSANTAWNASEADKISSYLTGGTPSTSSPLASATTSGVGQEMAQTSPAPNVSPEIASGIVETASALGIDPVDLGTAISYETAGTFDPTKAGPTTQWGQHKGLIQFGEPQAKQYGVDWNNPVGSQLGPNGAVANYLRSTGVKPGMGMMDIYSAINAGRVGRYGASDANNGGAPGTVADKVNQQMAGHRAKAMALFGTQQQPAQAAIEQAAPSGYVDPAVSVQPQAMAPELPAPVSVGQAPSVAAVPQPVAASASQPIQAPTGNRAAIAQALRVMNDPRSNPGTRAVANALLQREQGAIETAQKQALAQQQREQEIARRQAVAQQTGINPAYAVDDELWKGAAGNVFAAPSTSTVGANVIDNRTGQPIYQGTPEAPTSVQEYEYAKQQGYEGNYAQYQSDMKRASANNTTINNGEGNKFYNVLDENNAKTFSALSDTGLQARSNLAQVDQLGKLLETTPTGAVATLKQAAGEYGINTEGLSDIQAATALINKLVPAQRQPGSGSMSDQDLALFKQSLPRLINQPGSNATIINTLKGISQYQVQQGEIADRVANREMTPTEARKAIAELPNPLAGFKPPPAGKEDQGWGTVKTDIPGVTIRRKN